MEAYFRAVMVKQPENGFLHIALGSALLFERKVAEAIVEFREAVNLMPSVASAHSWLGTGLMISSLNSEAVVQFRRAIELRPTEGDFYVGLAIAQEGDINGGLAALQEGVKNAPNSAELHEVLCNVYLKQNSPDLALAECRAAMRIKPNRLKARLLLGQALYNKNDYQDASVEFREYLRLSPGTGGTTNPIGHQWLANSLYSLGRFEEAASEATIALLSRPGDAILMQIVNDGKASVHFKTGQTLYNKNDYQGASAEFREYIRLSPSTGRTPQPWLAVVHGWLAYSLYGLGRRDEAADEMRMALLFDPGNAPLMQFLSNLKSSLAKPATPPGGGTVRPTDECKPCPDKICSCK